MRVMDDQMSPDQIVSFRLTKARELRDWTQAKAAAEVSRCLGREWTIPVYSAAERSHRTGRVKEFSATEITAFCRAFSLPLAWFFLPPSPWVTIAPRGSDGSADTTADDLLAAVFPRLDDPMLADLENATTTLFSQFASQGPRGENLGTYLGWVQRQNNALRAMLRSEFDAADIGGLPEVLEDAAARMRRAIGMVVNDLEHAGIPLPLPADSDGESTT